VTESNDDVVSIQCGDSMPNDQRLKQCCAARYWNIFAYPPPAGTQHYRFSDTNMQVCVYTEDKSAIVTVPGVSTMIVLDIRQWVRHEFGRRAFAGMAWDTEASLMASDLVPFCGDRKKLLIYCLGDESRAMKWFKEHGGTLAQPWFALSEYDMEQLVRCLYAAYHEMCKAGIGAKNSEWVGHDVNRWYSKLKELKPHVPTKRA
jgi:hypothetical protein